MARTLPEQTQFRRDLLIESEPTVCETISREIDNRKKLNANIADPDEESSRVRNSLLEQEDSDPNGFERVIGRSDFVSVNFLARGIEAAKAVCRLSIPSESGGWGGTGFLAGPGLLVTNNHVLSTPHEASQAEAEFDFEHDFEGVLKPPIQFNLAPEEFFFTDIDHDITLVGINSFSDGGVPLRRFGWLPLFPLSGKGLNNEWVTIPQHPGGQPKQITMRANQIIDLSLSHNIGINTDRFIHYTNDTQPGSSGAPVLNDQWQVVAVHHKAIPKPNQDFEALKAAGKQPEWTANEGVRISAINLLLEELRFSDKQAAKALDRIELGLGLISRLPSHAELAANPDPTIEKDPGPHKNDKWDGWEKDHALGYDPKFLSKSLHLTTILGKQKNQAVKLTGSSKITLNYLHFSSIIHRERKFPIITAVNVDGAMLIHPGARNGRFRRDLRIANEYQPAANFYEKKLGNDPVQFSRGHLVRRFDPCWGPDKKTAQTADAHTFHYTNAAPQVQGFNAGDWLDIEDYVLNRAQETGLKVTFFSGPIFRDRDPLYGTNREGGPWRIPVTYWKIAVIQKANGDLAATAFMQGQTKFVRSLFETRVFTNLRSNTLNELQSEDMQTTIKAVEDETGLDFSMLRSADISNALESTRQTRLLRSVEDIVLELN